MKNKPPDYTSGGLEWWGGVWVAVTLLRLLTHLAKRDISRAIAHPLVP